MGGSHRAPGGHRALPAAGQGPLTLSGAPAGLERPPVRPGSPQGRSAALTSAPCAPLPAQLTRGHQVALSSISYIGCSLSVLCLAVTLATFAMLS